MKRTRLGESTDRSQRTPDDPSPQLGQSGPSVCSDSVPDAAFTCTLGQYTHLSQCSVGTRGRLSCWQLTRVGQRTSCADDVVNLSPRERGARCTSKRVHSVYSGILVKWPMCVLVEALRVRTMAPRSQRRLNSSTVTSETAAGVHLAFAKGTGFAVLLADPLLRAHRPHPPRRVANATTGHLERRYSGRCHPADD